MQDLTSDVGAALKQSGLQSGIATISVVGSTAAVTTIEFEPGLQADLRQALERFAPEGGNYEHEQRWGDDNGHSHIRASLIGPSVTIPFNDGKLELGAWQQIVLVDFDTRPRERTVVIQMVGE